MIVCDVASGVTICNFGTKSSGWHEGSSPLVLVLRLGCRSSSFLVASPLNASSSLVALPFILSSCLVASPVACHGLAVCFSLSFVLLLLVTLFLLEAAKQSHRRCHGHVEDHLVRARRWLCADDGLCLEYRSRMSIACGG